jgi:hypothetical protein
LESCNIDGPTCTDGVDLFGVDAYQNVVLRVHDGKWEIFAGAFGSGALVDGIGTDARFNYPSAIATDGLSVFVADSNNNAIRRIDIATRTVTTIATLPDNSWPSNPIVSMITDGSDLFMVRRDGMYFYVSDVYSSTSNCVFCMNNSGSADSLLLDESGVLTCSEAEGVISLHH